MAVCKTQTKREARRIVIEMEIESEIGIANGINIPSGLSSCISIDHLILVTIIIIIDCDQTENERAYIHMVYLLLSQSPSKSPFALTA